MSSVPGRGADPAVGVLQARFDAETLLGHGVYGAEDVAEAPDGTAAVVERGSAGAVRGG